MTSHPRTGLRHAPTVLAVCLLLGSVGCQSFHPFAASSKAKLASAKQWANRGLEAMQCGRINQAKGLFSRAAKENPNDFRMRANLARTHKESGDVASAILEMQAAVDLSPGDPKMLVELGELYLDSGQWLPAKRQAELALASNHNYAPAWSLSGKTAKAKGQLDQALADFQKALGFDPDNASVQLEIVDTYRKMGKPRRALSSVEQLLSKHPVLDQPESAVLAKSVLLVELDQVEPAIDILKTASQNENASSQIFKVLAQAQVIAGRNSQARLTLNRGKLVHPRETVFDELLANLNDEPAKFAAVPDRQNRY